MSSADILLKDVSVKFPIYNASSRSIKGKIASSLGGTLGVAKNNIVVIDALKHINLHFINGDRIGLIGHNGAGKSTLLRVLAGVYEPTSGHISTQGRIASLLNINLGIDPEATGRENIMRVGLMLGMSKKLILEATGDIVDFSELGEFIDVPIRTYSTGMRMRLLFAICTYSPPDILLMDEWLGVGDKNFLHKSRGRMKKYMENSGIIVVASHSVDNMAANCNKLLWLEHGAIKMFGETKEVLASYANES